MIIVVGPTASGKSELAVGLARKIGGEILSVDSRQIYRGLDIGSGKIRGRLVGGRYTYKGIRHYGIDIADARRFFSAAQFQKYAKKVIADIYSRSRIPILCGGTAHWIDAIVYDQKFPQVKPDAKLRKLLGEKSVDDLFKQLQQLDPDRATNIDRKNPRRLIRALEIIYSTGRAVPKLEQESKYDAVWLGIKTNKKTLDKKIDARLKQWLRHGMLKEIASLHKHGISWKRLEDLGLTYQFGALHLQKKISRADMVVQLARAIKHYAKRQMTWWKRNKAIEWIKS